MIKIYTVLEKLCLKTKLTKAQFINKYKPAEFKELTLEEAGEVLGITRERVRQIEQIAIKKIKRLVKEFDNIMEYKAYIPFTSIDKDIKIYQ